VSPKIIAGEAASEAAKALPPVRVAGLTLAGGTVNDLVLLATLLYTLLQMAWFVYSKFIRKSGDEPRIR
jgi:hypothetical protein